MNINIHVETAMRAIGIFLTTFFTVRWGDRGGTEYDTNLFIVLAISGIFLGRLGGP
jgi:hypothetical protein